MRIKNKRQILATVLSIVVSMFLVAGVVSAVTTLSANIVTGGNLTVDGNTTLGDSVTGDTVTITGTILGASPFVFEGLTADAFETTFAKFDKSTAEGKKKAASLLFPVIAKLPNKIEQAHWIQLLARELEVGEESIREELQKLTRQVLPEGGAHVMPSKTPRTTRKELLEERFLGLAVLHPRQAQELDQEAISYFSLETQEILEGFKRGVEFDAQTKDRLHVLSLKIEVEESQEDNGKEEFLLCLKEIRELFMKSHLERIAKEMKSAEEAKDGERVNSLIQEFHTKSRSLYS